MASQTSPPFSGLLFHAEWSYAAPSEGGTAFGHVFHNERVRNVLLSLENLPFEGWHLRIPGYYCYATVKDWTKPSIKIANALSKSRVFY